MLGRPVNCDALRLLLRIMFNCNCIVSQLFSSFLSLLFAMIVAGCCCNAHTTSHHITSHHITISGFTGRWRDCNLSELLRQLYRSDQRSFPASEFCAQSQYFSKIKDVMIALRACVTLSDADIDDDVGGALESLIAAAKNKYGDIFYGSIRSVYNRLLSARKE